MPTVNCRLVAIDLDGTLLNSQHQLSEEDCIAVRQLAESGIYVILASGRMHQTILPFSQQIGLQDPIISYNGGLVRDIQTGETLHHLPIVWEIASELIDWCVVRQLHLNFYVDDKLYVSETNQWSELYSQRTGATSHAVGDLHHLSGNMPTKMQIVDAPDRIEQLVPKVETWTRGRVLAIRTQPEYIEIINREVSKGRALLALSERFNIPRSYTVAVGDGPNDQSMLEAAGFSIAMRNAPDSIRAYADYITASNDQGGVAQAIRTLLL